MSAFTIFHVALSLVAIFSGLVVLGGMIAGKNIWILTDFFLVTTAATSLTGFCFFPYNGFTPGQFFGILSTILLAFAFYGRYGKSYAGIWAMIYAITATAALYLNTFVLVVQSFQKVTILKEGGPNSPEFIVTQTITFLLFLFCGILAARRFRPVN